MAGKTVRKVVKVVKEEQEQEGGYAPQRRTAGEKLEEPEGGYAPQRRTAGEKLEEQEEQEEPLDEIDTKIINRLKKTIIVKKELTEKQQKHLDKLASLKKGSRYKKVSDLTDQEVEDIPIKQTVRGVSPPSLRKVKKVKKAKKVIEPETESEETESESESEESSVPPPPKKKKLTKKTLKPQPEPVIQPKINLSLFRKSLF